MPLLRISFLLLLFACNPAEQPRTLAEEIRLVSGGKPGPYLVFTINPNDCFRCVNSLHDRLGRVFEKDLEYTVVLVLKERRSIERQHLFSTVLSDLDTTKVPLIWDDALYEKVAQNYSGAREQSLLLMLDAQGKTILCKPVKELTGLEPEIKNVFE